MGSSKPKFNKEKCLKCIWHSRCGSGWHVLTMQGEYINVVCGYSSFTGSTCLKRVARDELIDIRGEDYNACQLYAWNGKG